MAIYFKFKLFAMFFSMLQISIARRNWNTGILLSECGYAEKILVWQSVLIGNIIHLLNNYTKIAMRIFAKHWKSGTKQFAM